MTGLRCFLLERTPRIDRRLRRYTPWSESRPTCAVNGSYHDAEVFLDVIEGDECASGDLWPHDDPRWPTHCACGYAFTAGDTYQLFVESLYRRADTGEEMRLRDAGPGAMWDADWMHGITGFCGPDGRSMNVKCPPDGREWCIDSRAANCTMPDDNEHRCWVRHGEPPNLTVDKNGLTCVAGAGSIQTENWHGFLRDGELVP